jgi:hypothetical protein
MLALALNFIKNEWKPLLMILAALAIVGGVAYVQGLRADNARLELANSSAQAVNSALMDSLRAEREALEKRAEVSARLAVAHGRLLADLETIYETDEKAGDWSNSPIPDNVWERLRD